MANAKFSLNLNALSNDILNLMDKNNSAAAGGGGGGAVGEAVASMYGGGGDMSGGYSSDVSLPTASINGIFVDDNEAQLCVLKFTAYSHFPAVYGENNYTMCIDSKANQTTLDGYITSGRRTVPSTYDPAVLNAITEEQFKVGCAVSYKQGAEYLNKFYGSEGSWSEADFRALVEGMFLTAEVTVPISSNTGKVLYIKVINLSPENTIDIMSAYCMLDAYKDIFKFTGYHNGDTGAKWNELNPKFAFADAAYDHIKGEIAGFGKAAILEKFKPRTSESDCLFTSFGCGVPSSNQFFVRYFVDSSLRAAAEQKLGKKLPDKLCEKKAAPAGATGDNFATQINTNFAISGDLSAEQQAILTKPIQFSSNGPFKGPLITQKELRSNNSPYGPAGVQGRLTRVKVPDNYPLFYGNKRVKEIQFHSLAADRLEYALKDIINHYGPNIKAIAPGCCDYGGSYCFRKVRGGNSWSIHSWGTALDFDAGNNGMKTKAPRARLSQPIYQPFIAILAHYGFSSLGKNGNYDWMHFQLGQIKRGVVNP